MFEFGTEERRPLRDKLLSKNLHHATQTYAPNKLPQAVHNKSDIFSTRFSHRKMMKQILFFLVKLFPVLRSLVVR